MQLSKFSTQIDPQVLASIKELAAREGRQMQSVLDEALRDFLEKKRTDRPRKHVMEAMAASMQEFDSLYQKLAK